MKAPTQTAVIRRVLADAALDGRREWRSAADLAWEAGSSTQLTNFALEHLIDIGSVTRFLRGGFIVGDPERVLTVVAADRNLRRSGTLTSRDGAEALIAQAPLYAIGGTRAALRYLGGRNVIADHAPALVYMPAETDLSDLPPGDEATVLTADEHSLRAWTDGYTSPAQTYADLFAQPGWQAAEFRRALWRSWFAVDDWARAEEPRA